MAAISNILTFLIFFSIRRSFGATTVAGAKYTPRQALEIIIGGGEGGGTPPPSPEIQNCPPPPPPPCPPPPQSPPRPPPQASPPPPPPPSRPPSPYIFASQRLERAFPVIQAFKNKVKHDPQGIIKTWVGPKICQNYKGFICDVVPDFNQTTVAGINFNNRQLGGGPDGLTLAGFLDCLPDLSFFHANSNFFTGSIPAKVPTLRYLVELDLSNNRFSGEFPYHVLGATKLLFLDLRFNTFSGLLKPQIFHLTLDLLFVNNNNFLQKLPDDFGSTTAIFLSFANNKFVGPIPRSIGQASKTLVEVLFLNNHLSGCLPYEIGFLKKATVFDVGFNQLTGTIPHSFQCLEKIELLNLARNNFYGAVPEMVCGLPELSNFSISFNYFTQVGPKCRKLIDNGVLDVKMNCILDLENQRSPESCNKFFSSVKESCPDAKSLTYVPCSKGDSDDQNYVESSDFRSMALTPAPAPAPKFLSYGALSPH